MNRILNRLGFNTARNASRNTSTVSFCWSAASTTGRASRRNSLRCATDRAAPPPASSPPPPPPAAPAPVDALTAPGRPASPAPAASAATASSGPTGSYCVAMFTGRDHVCVWTAVNDGEAWMEMSATRRCSSKSGFFCARCSMYFSFSALRSAKDTAASKESTGRTREYMIRSRSGVTVSAATSCAVSSAVADAYGRARKGLSS